MRGTPGQHQTAPTSAPSTSQTSRAYTYPPGQPSHSRSNVVTASGGSAGDVAALSNAFGQMAMAPQTCNNQRINVVVFGEPGVGKSAVVNLIARNNSARVPSGIGGYPLQTTHYNILVDDTNFTVFETVGLEEPEMKGNTYLAALERAYEFVNKLSAVGGIHLLLFCIRANRFTTVQSNYRLFSEVVFQTNPRVPIAIVITGLEGEMQMEDWWTKNKAIIERYGLRSDGHACVGAVADHTSLQNYNYAQSQKKMRDLLRSRCLRTPAPLPNPPDWFLSLGIKMQQFVDWNWRPTQTDIVNVLKRRLGLHPQMVQQFLLGMMGRGVTQPTSRDDTGGLQGAALARGAPQDSKGEVESPKSDTTLRPGDLGAGKWGDDPQRAGVADMARGGHAVNSWKQEGGPSMRATGEAGPSQSQPQYLNAGREEGRDGKRDAGGRGGGMTTAQPQWPTETYVKNEMDLSMEDIRRYFPLDLTGSVTKSGEHPVASGSYGDIFKGRLSANGKGTDVAIKVYKVYQRREENLSERRKRFDRELRVWLNLKHENILPLYGTIRDTKMHPYMPAMVCPWIENGALTEYLEKYRDLAITKRLALVNDVAIGLQYLHSQQVIHGDLSGSNVLVNSNGRACIADFGLSTSLTAISGRLGTYSTSRQNKGTVRWMAPELIDPDNSHTRPTSRSDVYSFGSIMFQILSGTVPYDHLSRDEQVIAAIMKGRRPRRPAQRTITDNRWKFIERCWSGGPRPSNDDIVGFTSRELYDSMPVKF